MLCPEAHLYISNNFSTVKDLILAIEAPYKQPKLAQGQNGRHRKRTKKVLWEQKKPVTADETLQTRMRS